MDFIHFFGTTGSKEIFFNKIRSSGGLYLKLEDTNLIIDPGVNTFYKYMDNDYKGKIDGIILSHVHIDHSNDLNVFVELMTDGGEKKQGTLMLPNQAIEDKVLQPYLTKFPENTYILKQSEKYKIKNIEVEVAIEHRHGVENYGFIIKTSKNNIGLITDTGYFPELLTAYQKCDILIINVPYNIITKPNPKHLDMPAVEKIIKAIQPQKVVLTHFGKNILEKDPSIIAKELSEKYHTSVIAAQDDMILEIKDNLKK